jgi:CheY-like chemotaxis protein
VSFKGNILVAEDNKTNQMLIKILLEDYGLQYVLANDGLEALQKFKESKFDLVLMDESMPNMTGTEALIEILKYEKENALEHTPIVALSANVMAEDKKRFIELGMDDFLTKPIDTKELERVFKQFLP